MKTVSFLPALIAGLLVSSCMVAVNGPDTRSPGSRDTSTPPEHQIFTRATVACFPFQDNSNWWHYTETGNNTTTIHVTDTISDNGIMYYRVSFRENRVDTTDDWFQQSRNGIYFGSSLVGSYSMFLPAKIDSAKGSFISAGLTVRYAYYDSLVISGILFHGVLDARYSNPLLHGFDEITFANSIGIIQLIDHTGRWPIVYTIDSCSVSGMMKRF
jgi:hypothetical protein